MSITIGTNINSLIAQRNLRVAANDLSKNYERLSSGLRINSPSDDAAGLALAADLEADSRIANVALRNANDGISLTSIADSALGEVSNVLNRMLELATQSANGIITTSQRSALSTEFLSLGSEIDRIAKTTTFNSFSLLSNGRSFAIQVGFNSSSNSQISIGQISGTLDSLGLAATGGSALTYSIISTSDTGSAFAASMALSAVQNAIGSLTVTRGTVAAAAARLTSAVSYLEVARENFEAAVSRITDVDVAEEVAKMISNQVKQDAATAVLAQANQSPKLVLELLK